MAPVSTTGFLEVFGDGSLDETRWGFISEGDFEERIADVRGGRLRLRAATRGTRDDTVKFLGVRSVQPYPLGRESRISADLDWNHQANGSYLSAAIILAPVDTSGNPLSGPDWLKVEYVGVPPGKNGRMVICLRTAGRDQYLFTEGWPEVNREGRRIGLQKIEVVLRSATFEVFENGHRVYESKENKVPFDQAHLYLQMSSHSNYPPRELFFDTIRISSSE